MSDIQLAWVILGFAAVTLGSIFCAAILDFNPTKRGFDGFCQAWSVGFALLFFFAMTGLTIYLISWAVVMVTK